MLIKVSFKQISLNVLLKSGEARGLSEFNGERVPHHRAVYRLSCRKYAEQNGELLIEMSRWSAGIFAERIV